MNPKNTVYIAQSLDGFIADKNGSLKWLEMVPNPEGLDLGFTDFMDSIDALVMGRSTFETVCAFDMPWPYTKPVFVLSTTLQSIPPKAEGKAEIINGAIASILQQLNSRQFHKLYIDGGRTIQSFLKEDLIDELIITTLPVLLGGGSSLFAELPHKMPFTLIKSEVLLDQMTQNTYHRQR
ncbi:MAG: dihydrofolate reductase family protein [Bacteroidales bacterium]|jgi:dihydrofolate reductase|nr:dihydrofolate reductase family protein [Bacteroidales bacterium]